MTAVVCVVTLNAVASGALVLGAVAAENIAANTSVAGASHADASCVIDMCYWCWYCVRQCCGAGAGLFSWSRSW